MYLGGRARRELLRLRKFAEENPISEEAMSEFIGGGPHPIAIENRYRSSVGTFTVTYGIEHIPEGSEIAGVIGAAGNVRHLTVSKRSKMGLMLPEPPQLVEVRAFARVLGFALRDSHAFESPNVGALAVHLVEVM